MLRTLSTRNAKRQASQYLLYFISMIGVVALIYGFNALIFSDIVSDLANIMSQTGSNELGYMIVLFSIVIVFILGWFVGYMMNFMLRKRSQELSTYMILGIEKKQITKMFMTENSLIGLVALIIGWLLGILFAEILEAIVNNMFGSHYSLSPNFSLKAGGLTLLYFCMIYLIGLFSSRQKLKKMQLIDLLYYNDNNEKLFVSNTCVGIIILCISILCGAAGIWFFSLPLGNISDIFFGFLLAILCQLCLFIGLPPILHNTFGKNRRWKYRKAHVFLYRLLTSKINNASITLGAIATLLTLSIAFIGIGVSFYQTTNQRADLEAFDISILHKDEDYSFSQYSEYLSHTSPLDSSYIYNVYTGYNKQFMSLRNVTLSNYFHEIGKEDSPEDSLMSENRYDSFMKYSDYCVLREMLGYEKVDLEKNEFIIHCLPYLAESYNEYVSDGTLMTSELNLSCAGVYTETFSQYGGYGNGQEYILIAPDNIVDSLEVVYSLYVANFKENISGGYFSDLQIKFDTLKLIPLNISKSDETGYITRLIYHDTDYISGKYATQSASQSIILILPLIYLALIVSIIGTVILAIQLLSENSKNTRHYNMLKILGMENTTLLNTLRKHILIYYALPAVPAIILGVGLVSAITYSFLTISFEVPVINSIYALTASTVTMTASSFLVIYCIYGFITYISMKRDILNAI